MIKPAMRRSFFIFLLSLLVTQQASAVIFAPLVNYETYHEDNAETSSLMADLRLGTLLGTAFYVGAIYDIQNDDNGGASTDTWGLGPSAGLYMSNFSLIFSYYLIGDRKTPAGVKYTSGTGPQVDIGYVFDIGGNVKLGPDFTWRQQQWSNPSDKKVSSFRPYVTMFFEF